MGTWRTYVSVAVLGLVAACADSGGSTSNANNCPSGICSSSDGGGSEAGDAQAPVVDASNSDAQSSFTLGGSVSGYLGSGLVLENGSSTVSIAKGAASFAFSAPVSAGASYDIRVKDQPTQPSQTCTVANGSGTASANVSDANVTCATNTYTITATVNGLTGTGLVLQNNGADDLSVAVPASGTTTQATFSTKVASGVNYAVSVKTQPAGQICSVSGATGTVVAGPISSVTVNCTTAFTVGGMVSGLAGTGLTLQNNRGDNLTINQNGSFAFATTHASSAGYDVTVLSQPTNPWQTCSVTSGMGTVGQTNVTTVNVQCVTNKYAVKVAVSGLLGSGLSLQNRAGDDLAVSSDGTVTFSQTVASGQNYAVSVLNQPTSPWQTCTPQSPSGVISNADVTVTLVCSTNAYAVSGTISNLAGSGLVLRNNGGDAITIPLGATSFSFPTAVSSGGAYAVSVDTNPTVPSQTCTVANESGTIAGANVGNVSVTCTTNAYPVQVDVNGLSGSGLVVKNNGGDDLAISANGTSAFATLAPSGSNYNVTVSTQPTSPWQTCVVSSPSGTVVSSAVTVQVTCTNNTYTVGGTVAGLSSGSLVLQNNAGDDLAVTTNGSFTFVTPVASGSPYAVTVLTSPGLGCQVTSASGTVGGANVSSVSIVCATSQTFAFTGGATTFTVPGGVTSLVIEAWGAQGNSGVLGSAGGLGGYVTGTLAVTPGQVLTIYVGGGGTVTTAGGFNGGASAGVNGCATALGGGGGGATDVRVGAATLADRVLVAGGGGGGGGDRVATCGRGTGGGGGGGYYGGGGGAGYPQASTTVPTGGTQSAGGSGGTSTYGGAPNNQGGAGGLGVGGAGGDEVPSNQAGSNPGAAGGVGGDTTGGNGTYAGNFTGQSGAGGSGYIGGVTSGSMSSGTRSGNGAVVIHF